jgi:hypothetical protein
MTAELDVFSGRPNPQWQLTSDEWVELRRRIGALPAAAESATRSGLGYRGIVITPRGDEKLGFTSLLVSSGVIVASDTRGNKRTLEDSGRSLELWLLGLARTRLGSDMRGLIDEIIAAEPGLKEGR